MTLKRIIIFLGAISLLGCNSNNGNKEINNLNKSIPIIDYSYIQSYPHDKNSFTEGLFINDGKLYESSGAPKELPQTRSLIGVVDLSTGKISIKAEL